MERRLPLLSLLGARGKGAPVSPVNIARPPIGALGGDKLGVGSVVFHEQVRGAVAVEVRDQNPSRSYRGDQIQAGGSGGRLVEPGAVGDRPRNPLYFR